MNYEDDKSLEGEFLEYASIVKLTEGQEMTPAEISSAITALKNGIDLFKGVASAKDAATNSHFVHVIASMDLQLARLETELAIKERDLLLKDKEIFQLKEKIESIDKPKIADQLICKDPLWFVATDEHQVPVCRNCSEEINRFVYMSKSDITPTGVISGKNYKCPKCKDFILVHDEIEMGQYFIG